MLKRRVAVLKGLCLYLGEDDERLIRECTDIEGDGIQRDLQMYTMSVYAINKEGEINGYYDDVGIFVEGEIIMDNIQSPALASAVKLGVIYALNLAYPKDIRHYCEFIQKVLMRLDGEKLSSKVLGLKNKIGGGQ